MTFKCLNCGHIFEEGEQSVWSEPRGECHGRVCYEDVCGCPLCKGDFDKTEPCSICGAEHLEEELIGGVCENCIDECKYNDELCYRIGEEEKESIQINSFLLYMIGMDKIESILYHYLMIEKEKKGYIDCSPFIDKDKTWFAESLEREVKKNENKKN